MYNDNTIISMHKMQRRVHWLGRSDPDHPRIWHQTHYIVSSPPFTMPQQNRTQQPDVVNLQADNISTVKTDANY
jgi:hypothetical protein